MTVMYTGTLIDSLMETADRVRHSAGRANQGMDLEKRAHAEEQAESGVAASQSEEFAKALCLGAADGNLGLLLVVHPQLIRTLEPGYDFPDAINVHEI